MSDLMPHELVLQRQREALAIADALAARANTLPAGPGELHTKAIRELRDLVKAYQRVRRT